MKVKIEFAIDNAAYTLGEGENEIHNFEAVADTIDNIAERIRRGRYSGNIIDSNGNTVGHYSIS